MPLIPYIVDCADKREIVIEKRRWLKRLAKAGTKAVSVTHNVRLICLWDKVFWSNGDEVWGTYYHDNDAADIFLACGLDEIEIVPVLAHELAHYEQWRGGMPMSERWANKRTKEITLDIMRLL